MYCSPNFLAAVFKKQEISQQVVTRMQDLASEFSKKNFRGDTPGLSQREGTTPSRTQHPARLLVGETGVGTQTLPPLNFSAPGYLE